MNIKSIYLITGFLWGLNNPVKAQNYGYDAYSSCSSLALSNFASLNNPSNLINAKTTISYSLSNPYGIRDLYSSGLGLQSSNKQIGAGLSWENEGNKVYQLNKLGLCVAIKAIEELSIGVKAHLEHLNVIPYGSSTYSNFDICLSSHANPKIKTSFMVKNMLYFKTNFNTLEQNQLLQFGVAYSIEKRIKLFFEFNKSRLNPLNLKTALCLEKDSFFRLNICSSQSGKLIGIGLGIKKRKTEIGFALNAHIILGFSSCLSIAYEIKS